MTRPSCHSLTTRFLSLLAAAFYSLPVYADQQCVFQVTDSETSEPVAGLEFGNLSVGIETENGIVFSDVEGEVPPVEDLGGGEYQVTIPDGVRFVEFTDRSKTYCLGNVSVDATCSNPQVFAAQGECASTGHGGRVDAPPIKVGEKKTGTEPFKKGVYDQKKAYAVHKFLTTTVGLTNKQANSLCTGDCSSKSQACFPDSLGDAPGDGCDLRVKPNPNGGGFVYEIERVADTGHPCKLYAITCGCYDTES